MKLYYLKTCDTCRKAKAALKGQGAELIEIRDDGIPREELSEWLDRVGDEILVNRKSKTWRDLSDAARARPAIELLLENPILMKRPVVVVGNDIHVGWSAAVQASLGIE